MDIIGLIVAAPFILLGGAIVLAVVGTIIGNDGG